MADEVKATISAKESAAEAEYLFHLDTSTRSRQFQQANRNQRLAFPSPGKQIHGLRGMVKTALRSERVHKAANALDPPSERLIPTCRRRR